MPDQPVTPPLGAVRCALLSVSDRSGIVEFARGLRDGGVKLVATEGTAGVLEEAGLTVQRVGALTGTAELLGGRVKSLHPRVHAALLADRRRPEHLAELAAAGIEPIDLVCCNLYPFVETLHDGASYDAVIESIDVGGAALLRSAAKNHRGGVTVVIQPEDYPIVLDLLARGGRIPDEIRSVLSSRAFETTADYDATIATWSGYVDEPEAGALRAAVETPGNLDPTSLVEGHEEPRPLRHGENPHQQACILVESSESRGVAQGRQLHGKVLSYNNFLDLDAACRAVWGLGGPACAVVKHASPCGLAIGGDQPDAFGRALSGDPEAAYGSVLGFDRPLEAGTAAAIRDSGLFVECIAAPGFSEEALAILKRQRSLRLLEVPGGDPAPQQHFHRIGGGLLVQEADPGPPPPATWTVVTERQPVEGWRDELAFALHAAWQLCSNAVAITSARTLRGAGGGLASRVDACELALRKAGDEARGAFLASDGFFPFDDSVRLAAARGVVAVVQPGGSKRDAEVIAACDELGLVMLTTGRRHFRH